MITKELLKSDRLKFKNDLNYIIIEYNEEVTNGIRFTIKSVFINKIPLFFDLQ